jgi:hypothetical protein
MVLPPSECKKMCTIYNRYNTAPEGGGGGGPADHYLFTPCVARLRFMKRVDLSSLHSSSFDKASRDRYVSAGDRSPVSAGEGEYSTKELANQI